MNILIGIFVFGLAFVLIMFLMLASVVGRVVNFLFRGRRRSDNEAPGASAYQYFGQRGANSRRRPNSRHDSYGYSQQERYSTGSDGETVIDSRGTQEANKKIFSKDEGEYVDFEEN